MMHACMSPAIASAGSTVTRTIMLKLDEILDSQQYLTNHVKTLEDTVYSQGRAVQHDSGHRQYELSSYRSSPPYPFKWAAPTGPVPNPKSPSIPPVPTPNNKQPANHLLPTIPPTTHSG